VYLLQDLLNSRGGRIAMGHGVNRAAKVRIAGVWIAVI
jgi:hypothetical protein